MPLVNFRSSVLRKKILVIFASILVLMEEQLFFKWSSSHSISSHQPRVLCPTLDARLPLSLRIGFSALSSLTSVSLWCLIIYYCGDARPKMFHALPFLGA